MPPVIEESKILHRRTIRLPGFDYSQPGAYFVTVCTKDGRSLFGQVEDEEMRLNLFGVIAADSWAWLSAQYSYVSIDEYVVMPNHLHGVAAITDARLHKGRGGSRTAPTVKRKTLGRLVGAFKTVSTKKINQLRRTPGQPVWQRNYYEHVVRDDDEMNRVREYILGNPATWHDDVENPTSKAFARQWAKTPTEAPT